MFCKEVKPNLWDEGTSSWGFHHFQISKETLLSTCLICRSRKWRFSLSSSPLVLLSAKLTTTMTLILLICHSGILGILESVEKNLDLAGFCFESDSMRKHYRLSSKFSTIGLLRFILNNYTNLPFSLNRLSLKLPFPLLQILPPQFWATMLGSIRKVHYLLKCYCNIFHFSISNAP